MFIKFTFLIFINFFLLCQINGWVGIEKNDPKSNHSGHCFERTFNIGNLEKGQTVRIDGKCATATCLENKDIKFSGCPVVAIKPPCYIIEGDLAKEYPKCCFEIECKSLVNEPTEVENNNIEED